MRAAFVETLTDLARRDRRIILLTADLGWSVLEAFARELPDQFLNVGVAEQNMAGIATGLAQVGYVPHIYTISTFLSMRCYEQLRNGPILHGLPVRIIGVGGGFAYGAAGPTHHSLEDYALFRCQPGMTVLAPADRAQTRSALEAAQQIPGPVYIRVGKGGNPDVPGLDGRFALGRPEILRAGSGSEAAMTYLATGSITPQAVEAADRLARSGRPVGAAVLAHLGFRGSPELAEYLRKFRAVVTVEEAFVAGGLASLVAETIAEHGLDCRLVPQGVASMLPAAVGSAAYLQDQAGLSAEALARAGESVLDWLSGVPRRAERPIKEVET